MVGVDTRNAFVVAHVDVAPNTQAPALLQQLAEASRQEPGNLRFDVLQHAMRGNHFTVTSGGKTKTRSMRMSRPRTLVRIAMRCNR